MPNPCPTCTAARARGCPVHAPRHMEAAKPTGPLYDRILAALDAGPMVGNPEWRARQIAELVEGETTPLTIRLEAIQDVLGPLAIPNESEATVATRIAAKARLWDEVRPFLAVLANGGRVDDRKLWEFLARNEPELRRDASAL